MQGKGIPEGARATRMLVVAAVPFTPEIHCGNGGDIRIEFTTEIHTLACYSIRWRAPAGPVCLSEYLTRSEFYSDTDRKFQTNSAV